MLASVLRGDGHHRIAIAHESSLIGKEYLALRRTGLLRGRP